MPPCVDISSLFPVIDRRYDHTTPTMTTRSFGSVVAIGRPCIHCDWQDQSGETLNCSKITKKAAKTGLSVPDFTACKFTNSYFLLFYRSSSELLRMFLCCSLCWRDSICQSRLPFSHLLSYSSKVFVPLRSMSSANYLNSLAVLP